MRAQFIISCRKSSLPFVFVDLEEDEEGEEEEEDTRVAILNKGSYFWWCDKQPCGLSENRLTSPTGSSRLAEVDGGSVERRRKEKRGEEPPLFSKHTERPSHQAPLCWGNRGRIIIQEFPPFDLMGQIAAGESSQLDVDKLFPPVARNKPPHE